MDHAANDPDWRENDFDFAIYRISSVFMFGSINIVDFTKYSICSEIMLGSINIVDIC